MNELFFKVSNKADNILGTSADVKYGEKVYNLFY